MRILHLTNHCMHAGAGIVNVMVDLACLQAQWGHEVAVASSGGTFEPLFAAQGVRHHRLADATGRLNKARRLVDLPRFIRAFRPDVVHAHDMTNALAAFLSKPLGSFKLITTVHNVHDPTSRLMRVGDRVIAVSRSSVADMREWGIPERKIRVVMNGTLGSVRYAFGQALAPPPPLGDGRKIVCVAGIEPRKGIMDLVRAFNDVAGEVEDARLVLVGGGPNEEEYARAAAAMPHGDRIHFLGFHPDPVAFMKQATVFVLASHRESFGLVLTEARAFGCAIVASDVDGIPEALDGGAAGLLVPPGDPSALAAALRRLLTDPQELRRWREAAGRGLEKFSAERTCREVLGVYSDALGHEVGGHEVGGHEVGGGTPSTVADGRLSPPA